MSVEAARSSALGGSSDARTAMGRRELAGEGTMNGAIPRNNLEMDLEIGPPEYAHLVFHGRLNAVGADRGALGQTSGRLAQPCAGQVEGHFSARQDVEDDDFNLMCLGGRTEGPELAWDLVQTLLAAKFSGAERHRRRLRKVAALETSPVWHRVAL